MSVGSKGGFEPIGLLLVKVYVEFLQFVCFLIKFVMIVRKGIQAAFDG